MSQDKTTHEMTLTSTHPSGAEEWTCQECGRSFVMQLAPKFKRVILAEGDMHALHTTSAGGLQLGAPRIATTPKRETDVLDEQLSAWFDQIDGIDFGATLGDFPQ